MAYAQVALIVLLNNPPLGCADELAYGDVDEHGRMNNRGLTDIGWSTAPGAGSFFLDDPMESRDYAHTDVVHSVLLAQMKPTRTNSGKLASLEEELRPIFTAMPKNSKGRLNNGTARYALHRLFSAKQGWSIKGLQPAGASWIIDMSMDEEVKDISKYIVPSLLQDLILRELGVSSFDLHSLAILAATMEHMIHSEMINLVYSAHRTLQLPIPGKRNEQQVNDVLNTFLMVYAFGLNLDVSVLDDVTRAKLHLDSSHPDWPQLRAFAQEIKRSMFAKVELDFDEILRVVEKIGEKYVEWRGRDCTLVTDELAAKPSYSKGAVKLSEVSPLTASGHRELLTEPRQYLQQLGALSEDSHGEAELIIPNYINSQSMCLTTSSFYLACCVNECEGLLAKLEREFRAPVVPPEKLIPSMKILLQGELKETMVKELHGLKNQGTGLVAIHSRAFAQWMHKAFPLKCPAPDATYSQKATNPKTPDEWTNLDLRGAASLQDMMREVALALSRYTTMGAQISDQTFITEDPVSDAKLEVMTMSSSLQTKTQQETVPSAVYLAAAASMMMLFVAFTKSGFAGLRLWQQRRKKGVQEMDCKDLA